MNRLLAFFYVLVSGFAMAQEVPVKWKFEAKKISPCEYELQFKAQIEPGWHLYSLIPVTGDGAPNPTTFTFTPDAGYALSGKVTESKTHTDFDKDLELTTIYHAITGTFSQRVKVRAAGTVTVKGEFEFQVCREGQCMFPRPYDFSFVISGSEACASSVATATTPDTVECVCDTAAILAISRLPGQEKVITDSSVAAPPVIRPAKATTEDCNPLNTLFIGLGFGFAAVLMPCIYSLIPLTVSFFLKQSKTRVAGVRNSLTYGFFIIFIFVALTMSITAAFGPDALSNIATNTWLNLFFFALFVVFALSFFGLFEITLPNSWANKIDARSDQGGILGIFFMALTLVIVSFSCTVGFLGGLITAVAKGDGYLCPFMGFTGFGMGIALPFMLFAFFPTWLKSLPKSGGWMTTFKVTVAFLELALAVKFLANADNVNEWGIITREVFISLWIGIFAMLTLYLLGMFRTSHDDPPSHHSIGRILWATIFMSFTIYLVPGLWGAPLKLISSFPPPHHYAESPDGFGGHGQSSPAPVSGGEAGLLEAQRVTGPEGLRIFKDDYAAALKYARLVNKPLFIDFTGLACVNCRLMESRVWVKPGILDMLRDDVVIVSLYVDSKVKLPEEEHEKVFWYGKERTLTTYGDKWAYYQNTHYKTSSQPMYVVLDAGEKMLSDGIMGTELNEQKFGAWLGDAIKRGKAK